MQNDENHSSRLINIRTKALHYQIALVLYVGIINPISIYLDLSHFKASVNKSEVTLVSFILFINLILINRYIPLFLSLFFFVFFFCQPLN